MGICATYYQSSDREIDDTIKTYKVMAGEADEYETKEAPENSEEVADEQADDERQCELDKLWDVLHFLLTGRKAMHSTEGDCLSEAINGQINISGDEGEYVAGTYSGRVCEIARALQEVDFEKLLEKFAVRDLVENDVYGISPSDTRQEDIDSIQASARECFADLRDFYRDMAEKGRAVMVVIC